MAELNRKQYEDNLLDLILREIKGKYQQIKDNAPFGDEETFKERSELVKGAYDAIGKAQHYLKAEYKDELKYSKGDRFPYNWMLKGEVHNVIESCESFIPFVNAIHNRTRFPSKQKWAFNKMIAEQKRFIPQRLYLQDHTFSTFLTNKDFYDEMTKDTHLSKNTIQRYVAAFREMEIYKELYRGKNKGSLYADGYYTKYNDKLQKHSFVTKAKKDELLLLPDLIKVYAKKNRK